jgi:hypothetical protein
MKKTKEVELTIFRDITLSYCEQMCIEIPTNLTEADENLFVKKYVEDNQWDVMEIGIGEPNLDDWMDGVKMIELHKNGDFVFRDNNP